MYVVVLSGWSSIQVLQLYQISVLSHGLMMVGPSGSGKSTAWRVLMRALERLEGVEGVVHVIEPKVNPLGWRELEGRGRWREVRRWAYGLYNLFVAVMAVVAFRPSPRRSCMVSWTLTLANGLMGCSLTFCASELVLTH